MSYGVCHGRVFICIVSGLGRPFVECSDYAVAPESTPLMSRELRIIGHRPAARARSDQLADEKLTKTKCVV
jgi:hypothetical protein